MHKRRRPGDHNRTIAQATNSRGFWCPYCDRCIVLTGQRCPECGNRNNRKKLKPSRAVAE